MKLGKFLKKFKFVGEVRLLKWGGMEVIGTLWVDYGNLHGEVIRYKDCEVLEIANHTDINALRIWLED